MRIIFFSHDYYMYGANRSLTNLISGIRKIDPTVEMHVLCPKEGDFTEWLLENRIPYTTIPYSVSVYTNRGFSRLKSIKRQINNFTLYGDILKICKSFKPDIIHTNTSVFLLGAYASHNLSVPHVWHIREFGLKDYNQKFDFGRKNLEKWINRASAVIAISKSIQKEILHNIQAPIHQIYNGVFREVDLENLPPKTAGKFVFCLVGALYEKKGQLSAIKRFYTFAKGKKNIELWLVGKGDEEYENRLRKSVEYVELQDQIKFLGYQSNPLEIISQADVGLMCSENEAMGRVTVEYMACGLPVIGKNSGGTAELIENGVNGFLYSTKSEFKEAMEKLYSDDKLRVALGEKGKKMAIEKFEEKRYAENVYEVMKSVVIENPTSHSKN